MTKAELRKKLEAEGFRKDAYLLDGGWPDTEGFVLTEVYGKWLVEFVERGMRSTLTEATSEEEACEKFYKVLQRDSAAKRH